MQCTLIYLLSFTVGLLLQLCCDGSYRGFGQLQQGDGEDAAVVLKSLLCCASDTITGVASGIDWNELQTT